MCSENTLNVKRKIKWGWERVGKVWSLKFARMGMVVVFSTI